MPKKKKKSKNKKKPLLKKRKKVRRKTSKKVKTRRRALKKTKSINKKKKIEKSQSDELIFKTKQEWIKNGLANKSQYQTKYNESIKNNNSFWKKEGKRITWINTVSQSRPLVISTIVY